MTDKNHIFEQLLPVIAIFIIATPDRFFSLQENYPQLPMMVTLSKSTFCPEGTGAAMLRYAGKAGRTLLFISAVCSTLHSDSILEFLET